MHNQTCPDWAEALLNGFSQIFLQRQPLCGLLCLLAILIGAPALLGGALLGGVAGLLTAQRRGYPKAERQAGLYSYNGVLLGLLISQHFAWSALLPPLILACGGLSAILTRLWLKRATQPDDLPAYTAPVVLLGWMLLGVLISQHFAWSALLPPLILACGGLSAILTRQWLKHASQPDDLPAYTAPFVFLGWLLIGTVPESTFSLSEPDTVAMLTAPFTGLAQIMLLDQPLAGALIALGLWLANRRAAVWALIGASAGVLIALWLEEPAGALLGLHSYNPALAALALSQVRRQPWHTRVPAHAQGYWPL